VRWPGLIKPGTEINAIFAQEDWLPTLVAAAGEPSIKDELLKGYPAGEMTYKVHLDGYDQRDLLAGKGEGARKEFLYWTDDGDLSGLRYNQWKLVFMEQRAHGLDVWQDPLVPLRFPKLFNLRTDPFETADYDSIDYAHWRIDRIFLMVPAQTYVAQWLSSFKEYPPRQKPGSFSLEQVMGQLVSMSGDN
jgi:arylsulfatase